MSLTTHIAYCLSPLGALEIHASPAGLHAVHFPSVQQDRSLASARHADLPSVSTAAEPFELLNLQSDNATEPLLKEAVNQLRQYFAGERQTFTLPLAAAGTLFQQQVWRQLGQIPFGHTQSYGELAQRLGNKNAMRAVGAANGRNPIAIVVPCHRVIGADGKLTGYAGGLDRKIWLLQHEQRVAGHFRSII
ncbi:MAG: methylated-DNA--[protein]-cysteine S-methyltransferase [Chromatiaceae bacterium]|jgi:methylated-DNA-[protein]-cysteine S-methyltransferase